MSGSDASFDDDDSLLAAEYVLGVLEPAERRAVAARAATDAALAGDIAAWERRLAPLALLVPPVAPPPELWDRIQRAMGGTVETMAPPRRAAATANLRAWRVATFASLALAAGFAVVAFLPRNPIAVAPHPVAIAALAPLSAAGPAFLVRVAADGALDIAPVQPASVPTGRDLELWALPQGATRPVPLGVLPVTGERLAASRLTAPGGKLLISLEPKGGSPTGLPTGPVLYGGVITPL